MSHFSSQMGLGLENPKLRPLAVICAENLAQIATLLNENDKWPANQIYLYGNHNCGHYLLAKNILEKNCGQWLENGQFINETKFLGLNLNEIDEESLLAAFMQSENSNQKLIICAEKSPKNFAKKSADLASRLNTILAYDCEILQNSHIHKIIDILLKERGIKFEAALIEKLAFQYIHSFAILELFESFLIQEATNLFNISNREIFEKFAIFQAKQESDLFDHE